MDHTQEEIEQYRKELSRDRTKVSDSAQDIIQSTVGADPLRDGVNNAVNPFKTTKSCTIL